MQKDTRFSVLEEVLGEVGCCFVCLDSSSFL